MSSEKRPQVTSREGVQQLLDLGHALRALLVDDASEAELIAITVGAEARREIEARRAEDAFLTALVGADVADDPAVPPEVRTFVRRHLGMPARRGIQRVVPHGLRELHAGIARVIWRAKREKLTLAGLRAAADAELPGWHRPLDVLAEVARRGDRGLRVVGHRVLVDERPSRVASEVVGAWVAERYGARAGRSTSISRTPGVRWRAAA